MALWSTCDDLLRVLPNLGLVGAGLCIAAIIVQIAASKALPAELAVRYGWRLRLALITGRWRSVVRPEEAPRLKTYVARSRIANALIALAVSLTLLVLYEGKRLCGPA